MNLFLSASAAEYSDTLTKFTFDMAQPLYLDGPYSVALTQISLPPSFPLENSLSSRDSIVFEQFNYSKLYPSDTFEDFINATLRIAASDVKFYGEDYFRDFADKDIFYSPYTFAQTHSLLSSANIRL